jgi:Peptide N-acetyl-beta-D-glucosaminyl asparaginase amidase A
MASFTLVATLARFVVAAAMRCLYYFSPFTVLPLAVWTQPLPGDPLRNFQVSQPLRFPDTEHSCDVVLVHHLFSNSFGQPAVVEYDPPQHCGTPGTWAAIGLNITATSNGVDCAQKLRISTWISLDIF